MASLRAAAAALAVVGGIVAAISIGGLAAVGCGGDTGPFGPTEAGDDESAEAGAGADGTSILPDTGRDTSAADAGADATGGGGGDAADGGADANATVDAIAAADSSGDGDATINAGDARDAAPTVDVTPTLDVGNASDAADATNLADVFDAAAVMDSADAGADATVDAGGGVDTGSAVDSGIDAGSTSDSSDATAAADAFDAGDAAAVVDATDASDAASAVDAADAADAGDAKVIPPGLLAYPGQYATAICTGLANCCGATFDLAACKVALASQGYDNTLPLNPSTYGNGNLTFNAARAAVCVTSLQNWPCGATITSLQNQTILQACHSVLGGTIPIGGSGCVSSFECVGGAYCANGGICTALAGVGGACDVTGESPDHQCSEIALGLSDRYCAAYPSDGGVSSGTGTCQTVQPNGAGSLCSDLSTAYSDYACANQTCDFANTATCVAATTNPAAPGVGFECRNFVIRDAGGG